MTDSLQKICIRFRGLTRRALLSLGVSRWLVVVLAVAFGLILADYIWHFSHAVRFLALAILLASASVVFVFDLLRPLQANWSDKQILNFLDTAIPGSEDRLVNLEELSQPDSIAEAASPEGRAIVVEAVAQLQQRIGDVDVNQVVRRRIVGRWLMMAAGVVLFCSLLGAAFQLVSAEPYTSIGVRRLLMPWATIRWPSSTWFVLVTPAADTSVPEGEALAVRAEVHGRVPGQVSLIYNTLDEEGKANSRAIPVTMFVGESDVAEYKFPKLSDSVRFHIEGGDGSTAPITVNVVKRPYIRNVAVYYKFPPYTGIPPKVSHSPQLSGLEGTDVRIVFSPSTPLDKAWIQMDGSSERIDLPVCENGKRFEWFHQLAKNAMYSIALQDRYGNREKNAETYRIKVTPDQPPQPSILEPAGDLEVTARARFPVRFAAKDDYGLKEVRFFVAKDDEPPQPLPETITGPIRQIGKNSAGTFSWDLEKMDLAGVARLTYFLAALDVNPTGRGKSRSASFQLTIRSEIDIQQNVLLAARSLLTEAQLGSDNQRWAYLDGVKWQKTEGKTELDKALLKQMLDEQALAARAAEGLEARFKLLNVEMVRNRMEDAFFDRRLQQIGALIFSMANQGQPQLAKALAEAKPRTSAEDTPAGRVTKMRKVLAKTKDLQKSAALEYQRLLNLLRDWNDLQNVLVKGKRLQDLQRKVYETSFSVAPKWIGKEIEDLSEKDARLLETLGQQQEAIREAESALEEELQTLALAARDQARKQVFVPLKENLELLRLRGVSDKLIQCAKGIKDNRIDATLQNQLYVVKVFTFVAAKLEQAGRDVRNLNPINLALVLKDDRLAKTVAAKPPITKPGSGLLVFNPESKVDVEDIGAYKVNTIEQAMVFLQSILENQVLLYTQYTHRKFTEEKRSPRYRRLRVAMLVVRAQRALEASKTVGDFAGKHPYKPIVPYWDSLHGELENVEKLIAAGQLGPPTQDLLKELIDQTQTARRFLAHRSAAVAQMEDRNKKQGRDEFDQKFVVAGENMSAIVQMRELLGWASVLQNEVIHKTRRGLKSASVKEPLVRSLITNSHKVAIGRQQTVVSFVDKVLDIVKKRLSDNGLTKRLRTIELPALEPKAFDQTLSDLKIAKMDAKLPARQEKLLQALKTALANLDSLSDERIRPKEQLAKEAVEAQQAIGKVDLKKSPTEIAKEIAAARKKALHDFQFTVIAERIKKSSLKPEVQAYLLQSLRQQPDPRYQPLVSAYFNSLLPVYAKKGKKDEP